MAKRRKKRKWLIQIKSSRNRWTTVEWLEWKSNNRMKIRLPSGQIVNRKVKNVRFSVVRTIQRKSDSDKDNLSKKYKTKKKRKTLDKRKPKRKSYGRPNREKMVRFRYRGNTVYGQRKSKL